MPRTITVIESQMLRGNGKDDPLRTITQYHTPEGDFLAENDPCSVERTSAEDLMGGYDLIAKTLQIESEIEGLEGLVRAQHVVTHVARFVYKHTNAANA